MFDCEYGNQEHFAMIAIYTIPGRTCQSRWAVGRKSLAVSLALPRSACYVRVCVISNANCVYTCTVFFYSPG